MAFPARRIRTRASNRGTLQPTIQDFNNQIIDDEILYIDAIGRSHSECSFFSRIPPPFKQSTVKYSGEITKIGNAGIHLPAPMNSPRDSMTSPEQLHRRHVVKSARVRSKLALRKQGRKLDYKQAEVDNGSQGDFPAKLSSQCQEKESPRMVPEKQTESLNFQPFRVRPATTGRYFDSSNGLRTSRSLASSRSHLRPHTASSWNGCGLRIQRLTLNPKDTL